MIMLCIYLFGDNYDLLISVTYWLFSPHECKPHKKVYLFCLFQYCTNKIESPLLKFNEY